MAGCRDNTVSLAPTVSNRCRDYCLSNFSVSGSTLHDCKYSLRVHFNALRSLTQPCLTAYCIRCNTSMVQAVYPWESVSEIQSIKENVANTSTI